VRFRDLHERIRTHKAQPQKSEHWLQKHADDPIDPELAEAGINEEDLIENEKKRNRDLTTTLFELEREANCRSFNYYYEQEVSSTHLR